MHTYTVISNDQLTSSTNILTLHTNSTTKPFSFEPGQYAAISFYSHKRPTVARCFSIVSSPTQEGILQFSMRTGGRFTKTLSNIKPGETVKVRGPFGGFVFDWQNHQNAVFLAGGIGITPFMSILRFATQKQSRNKITLIYSFRNQQDIPFVEELKQIQLQNPNITVVFVVNSGPVDTLNGQMVQSGRITPELLDKSSGQYYQDTAFYICGPPPFMNGMVKTLADKQTPESNVITEAFGQGSHRQTGKIKSWPFNIYALGAVGVAFAGLIVLISDVLKTIPASSITGSTEAVDKTSPASSRQADLDKLVNELSTMPSTGTPSDAVLAAQKAAIPKTATAAATVQQAAPKPNSSTGSTTVSSPAPTVKPAPVCTTSPSGIRTCI